MADTSVSYKCPSCGGPLEYKPGLPKIKCDYCDTVFSAEQLADFFGQKEDMAAAAQHAKETSWEADKAGSQWTEEEAAFFRAFTCSSCGAEISCDENTMATECVYCGNPTMVAARFSGTLKPDYIIPFKKTKAEAVAALTEFYKGKWLLPGAFTENNRVEHIQGLYVPFWMFNSRVRALASIRAENDHIFTTGKITYKDTSVYECTRLGEMSFAKIPADGSVKMADDYMDSIEPFDYSELVPFQASYMAGFLADRYDVTAEQNEERVNARINSTAETVLRSTVSGYDRTMVNECAVEKLDSSVEYAMVPVWILTTRYQDKPYTFMMNGQTGKMVGALPYSSGKAMAAAAAGFALSLVPFYYLCKFVVNMFD